MRQRYLDGNQQNRTRFTEYTDTSGTVGMIYEPQNDDAWIRSTHTLPPSVGTIADLHEPAQDDSKSEAHHLKYDSAHSESLSMVIIMTVADIVGADPLELDPLYESIEPERLDEFVSPSTDEATDSDGPITFTYHDYTITVHQRGHVVIRRPE